jgi:hypothetical protein
MHYIKLLLIAVFSVTCYNTYSQGYNDNQLDSLGLKQGKWFEYRALPHLVLTGKRRVPLPGNSKAVWWADSLVFNRESPVYKLEGEYINGLKNGIWKEFYDNGKIRREVNYLNGIPSGLIRVYHPNGNLIWHGFFSNHTYMTVEYFNEDGTFMMKKKVAVIEIAEWLYSLKY